MSENAINAFGLMVREGPCYHCGIDYTPLWRCGPPEKPVLCNACGSRWRTRKTLKDYIPKHANKDYYSSKENQSNDDELPSLLINPTNSSSILNLEEEPPKSSLSNSVGDVHQFPLHILERVFSNVARKKRSKLGQYVLSPTERFHQQLCHALEDLEVAKGLNDEAVLIFEQFNNYILGNEIGLGCILLKPHDVSPTMINNTKPKFSTIDVKSAPSPGKGSISDQSSAC